jgi:hypothetical protein
MIANDNIVKGWRRLNHALDHPLSIRPIDEVRIDSNRDCLLQESIDTVITVPLVPVSKADAEGEDAETAKSKFREDK